MSYVGFYINLDRSHDRRQHMLKQLEDLQLQRRYNRFVASDGNELKFPNQKLREGEMGCFTSHYLLLKQNLNSNIALHVVEDDVVFAKCMEAAISTVVSSQSFQQYDLVYTDTSVPTSNNYFRTYKLLFDKAVKRDASGKIVEAEFQLMDMQDRFFGTTSSFLVNPKSIRKIHDLYERELTAGASEPIDFFIREQVKNNKLKVGCVFPFISSIKLNYILNSTINLINQESGSQLHVAAFNVARHSFFIDCDLKACLNFINQHLPLPRDSHLDILTHILGYSCTESFADRG